MLERSPSHVHLHLAIEYMEANTVEVGWKYSDRR